MEVLRKAVCWVWVSQMWDQDTPLLEGYWEALGTLKSWSPGERQNLGTLFYMGALSSYSSFPIVR